jgi:DNA-binding NarL/FixJ family response regulator
MTSRTTRIVIADDDTEFHHTLQALLPVDRGYDIVAGVESGAGAVSAVQQTRPDILLMDLRILGVPAFEVIKRLSKDASHRTIVLGKDLNADIVFEALMAGAHGVVAKDSVSEALRKCINSVLAGEIWVSRFLVKDLLFGLRCVDKLDGRNGMELVMLALKCGVDPEFLS